MQEIKKFSNSIPRKPRHFMWQIGLGFFVLLLFSGLIALGFWQLDRAEQKRVLIHAHESRMASPAISLSELPKNREKQRYQPVEITGYYENKWQFLLDNKIHKGVVGYEVLTPFVSSNESKIVLVNRGWISAGQSRKNLPRLKPVEGLQTVRGLVYIPSGKLLVLSQQQEKHKRWPLRVQSLDFKLFAEELRQPVYPFLIQLSPTAKHGFVRDWIVTTLKPEKHIGYAVQWFALAAALLVLLIIVYLRRGKP